MSASENVIVNDSISEQTQTTDASSTPIATYNLNENFSGEASFVIVGKNTSTGDTCVMNATFAVKRGTGSAHIVGSTVYTVPLQSDLSLATVTATPGTFGGAITVSVSGVIATTIDWWCLLSVSGIFS